jgi:hypothetical protein
MPWQQRLEPISESVHDYLRRRHDDLVAEHRLLRQQSTGRVQRTDSERKELAERGAQFDKNAVAEIATMATSDPVLAWKRQFADQQVASSAPPKVGRPSPCGPRERGPGAPHGPREALVGRCPHARGVESPGLYQQ